MTDEMDVEPDVLPSSRKGGCLERDRISGIQRKKHGSPPLVMGMPGTTVVAVVLAFRNLFPISVQVYDVLF